MGSGAYRQAVSIGRCALIGAALAGAAMPVATWAGEGGIAITADGEAGADLRDPGDGPDGTEAPVAGGTDSRAESFPDELPRDFVSARDAHDPDAIHF